jgi:uncharacterized protein
MSCSDELPRDKIDVVGLMRNRGVVCISLGLLALLVLVVAADYGWRRGLLVVVGALLGVALYHASFGFTSAWRVFVFERRGAGVQAQLVMLAIAVTIFFPILAAGEIFGQPVRGFVSPVGWSVALGAFIFGIGMQLGGGCASGTLFTVGGGNTRMVLTLLAFITGAVLVTFHLPWWHAQPSFGAISLVDQFGWFVALVLNLSVFAVLFAIVGRLSTRETRSLFGGDKPYHWLRGPWPLLWGAVALALLNAATLLLAASRAGASKTASKTIRVAGLESCHATITSAAMTPPYWGGLIDTVPISLTRSDSCLRWHQVELR